MMEVNGHIAPVGDPGRRSFVVKIDQLAVSDPDGYWASVYQPDSEGDWLRITWVQLSDLINQACHWIVEHLGKPIGKPTIGFIDQNGPFYLILAAAAFKTGYRLLVTSPKNSPDGHANLIKQTDCHTFLYRSDSLVDPVVRDAPWKMQTVQLPSLEEWLKVKKVAPYPYVEDFDRLGDEQFFVLHTSGSTGLPKPIPFRKTRWLQGDLSIGVKSIHGRPSIMEYIFKDRPRFLVGLPLYHSAGIGVGGPMTIFWHSQLVLPPRDRPFSAHTFEQMIESGNVDIAMVPPSVLEEMCESEDSLRKLAKLKIVMWSGGPLANWAGDILSKRVRLLSVVGATELGVLWTHVNDADAWNYFVFNDDLNGVEWRPVEGEDSLYELVMVKKPGLELYQDIFKTFPDLNEYSMKDLYEKHPTKPHHMRYVGRADDVIVLSNGEKFMPRSFEGLINKLPEISDVVVVGQGRFQTSMLVEPKKPLEQDQHSNFIDKIWPTIVAANKNVPAHARLDKQFIIITIPDKPFPRTAKGTVRRGILPWLFKEELETLYAQTEQSNGDPDVDLSSSGGEATSVILSRAIEETVGQRISAFDDFFNAGLDSLHVRKVGTFMRKTVGQRYNFFQHDGQFSRLMYEQPSILKFVTALESKALEAQLSSSSALQITNGVDGGVGVDGLIEQLTTQLSAVRKPSTSQTEQRGSSGRVILLTGSTGSLGPYLLHYLVLDPSIESIICLNRSPDAQARHTKDHAARGLTTDFAKVSFHQADLSKPSLGLQQSDYSNIQSSITVIIHSQWRVDFNMAASSFAPQIRGTANLASLALSAAQQPCPLLFLSTIGTARSTDPTHLATGLVPELPLLDPSCAQSSGYAQSKQATHRLLQHAAERSGLSAAVLRLGQIAGPAEFGERGEWKATEWLPSLVAASRKLRAVPAGLGKMELVDWVPVDVMARAIVEIARASEDGAIQDSATATSNGNGTVEKGGNSLEGVVQYYHLVNPRDASWSTDGLRDAVRESLSTSMPDPIETIPLEDWVTRLRAERDRADFDSHLSALSLTDWYARMADTGSAKAGGGGGAGGRGKDGNEGKNGQQQLLSSSSSSSSSSPQGSLKLDTTRAQAASQTLKGLGAVSAAWMALWMRQWERAGV